MSNILFNNTSGLTIASPPTGKGRLFVDSVSQVPVFKNASGIYIGGSTQASVAAQGAGFSSDTYVTGSNLLIPSFGMQAGMTFIWQISASKTAASTATPVYTIRTGALATTGDTARLALTGPAQTAAADVGILTVMVTVRTVAASGVIQGTACWSKSADATGFANNDAGAVEGSSAGFDNTAMGGGVYVGLSINGGASSSWTLTQVLAEIRY